MVIDGKKIADEIISKLKQQPKSQKFFGAFLVGDDPASISFLKQKERIAKELGVDFRLYRSSTSIVNDELRKEVLKTAKARTCGGIIMQLPLPKHLNKHYVMNVIPREKDVDVLGERALGAFYAGRNPVLPPAVGVVEKIIQNSKFKIQNSRVAVIGRGLLVGKPVAIWLMEKVAELSVFASTTKDLRNKLKDADIIISGVGKAGLFGQEDVKKDALIIDFGYDMVGGKISGDFNPLIRNSRFEIHYTPTPGGTGPILVAKLFENFYKLTTR